MNTEPTIRVGVVSGPSLDLEFSGTFTDGTSAPGLSGGAHAYASGERIVLDCPGERRELASGAILSPAPSERASFLIRDVTIGVDFHWQRKEDQRFTGALALVRGGGTDIVAINVVALEDYLASVISSEMSPACSMNLLRAHAMTSRSWLLAQLEKSREIKQGRKRPRTHFEEEGERIRWYDREDHALFDVCADDHCQRYRGITSPPAEAVRQSVEGTRGWVVTFAGNVCDARFSKSCGGITEPTENVWENVSLPYLVSIADRPRSVGGKADVREERAAREWICGRADAFCNTADRQILEQVLPKMDQETTDFFRWKVLYSQDQLSAIVRDRSGIDFGRILDLLPRQRGPSGRLNLLTIVGEKKSLTIGKELEIRRTLSRSHLKSSAFVIDKLGVQGGVAEKFVLTGAGWGHGVGLCQIGAAVMGEQGYSPEEILMHYFPGTELKRLYGER